MKVLAFLASTRKNGNTEKLLELYLEKVKYNTITKIYNLKDLKFENCIACYCCEKDGKCVLKDDLTSIYKEIDEADIIIFASPVYFNSITALGKKLVDRMQCYWSKKYLLKIDDKRRIGVFLSTGGAVENKKQFLGSTLVMDYFFSALNCKSKTYILVPDTDRKKVEKDDERFNVLKDFHSYDGKEIIINN